MENLPSPLNSYPPFRHPASGTESQRGDEELSFFTAAPMMPIGHHKKKPSANSSESLQAGELGEQAFPERGERFERGQFNKLGVSDCSCRLPTAWAFGRITNLHI